MANAVINTCSLLDDIKVAVTESAPRIVLHIGTGVVDEARVVLSLAEAQDLLTQLSTIVARQTRYAAQQAQQVAV